MKIRSIILALIIIVLVPVSSFAAITVVNLTQATPTTLSNGKSYYLAGVNYTFRVQATDPLATGRPYWNQIILRFYEGATVRESCVIDIDAVASAGGEVGLEVVNVTDVGGAPYTNITYDIEVRFLWDAVAYTPNAANRVEAYVDEDGASNGTDTNFLNYGVITAVKILNFAQDGNASDNRVNPWHLGFNVTGSVVYDDPAETGITNTVVSIDATEITDTSLQVDGGASGYTDNTMGDDLSYAVAANFFSGYGLGDRTWSVDVDMSTGTYTETSSNTLTVNNDRVEITNITYTNGGGVDSPFYRSVNVAGTRIELTVRMQNGLGAVVGNTTFRVNDGTNQFTVTINDGGTTGSALIIYPTVTNETTDDTVVYEIDRIYGGAYDGDAAGTYGQNSVARITQTASPTIYWDNNDPPGSNSQPFTTWVGVDPTTDSLTFSWTPLTTGAPNYDGDFSSYRLYFKKSSDTSWIMYDSSVDAALGTITTGSYLVSGLDSLTSYDYYLTAIDVFGQEVYVVLGTTTFASFYDTGGDYGVANTTASSITVSISDGIDSYDDATFTTSAVSTTRPVRDTSINVSLYVVTSGTAPSAVNIIIANDTSGDLVTGGVLNGTLNTDYYRISCTKTAPNTYRGYIPSENALMQIGTSIKFIAEIQTTDDSNNVATNYVDHNSELEAPPGDPNDYEWNFSVSKTMQLTPWPVRILNNVITDKNPVAYPSYYLTDDAQVSIRIYDIKGRKVVTLLENASRKGGQNIKENGWRGVNKASKKLGPGLYYIHIRAKRLSDNKVILNKFKKVVIAR
jgi:hypothetical protein